MTSSTQNLSELSPPIISHSSTMTDMDMDITSSSDTNQNLTETAERKRVHDSKYNTLINNIVIFFFVLFSEFIFLLQNQT